MGTGWIVRRGNRETSPIPLDKLVQVAKAGRLLPEDWVRQEHQTDWQQARNVPGLFVNGQQKTPETVEATPVKAGLTRAAMSALKAALKILMSSSAFVFASLRRRTARRNIPALPQNGSTPVLVEATRVARPVCAMPDPAHESTKACAYCGESILMEARKCKHCGEMLDPRLRAEAARQATQQASTVTVKRGGGLISSLFKLVFLGVVAVFIGTCIMTMNNLLQSSNLASSGANSTTAAPRSSAESTEAQPSKQTPQVRKMGDTVSIGYTSYCVWSAEWKPSIGKGFLVQKPNAAFLILNISVRNDDKKARTVPPLKLVDDNGNQYDAATAGMMQGNDWFNVLEDLNPSVTKQGNIAFDVPTGRKYKLTVSGGYWSTDTALIEVTPKQTHK